MLQYKFVSWSCNEYALDIMVVNIDSQNVGSPHDVHEVPLGFLVLTSYWKFNEGSWPIKYNHYNEHIKFAPK